MINETLHTFISVTKTAVSTKRRKSFPLPPLPWWSRWILWKKASVPLSLSGRTAVSASHRQENLFWKMPKPSSGTQENPSSARRSPQDKSLICRHAAHRRRTLPILPAPSPLTGKKGTGVNRRDATQTLRKPRGNPRKKFMKFSKKSWTAQAGAVKNSHPSGRKRHPYISINKTAICKHIFQERRKT